MFEGDAFEALVVTCDPTLPLNGEDPRKKFDALPDTLRELAHSGVFRCFRFALTWVLCSLVRVCAIRSAYGTSAHSDLS